MGNMMVTYEVHNPGLPARAANLLFMQWIHHLAAERLGLDGWGTRGEISPTAQVTRIYTFGSSAQDSMHVTRTSDDRAWRVEVEGVERDIAQQIVAEALKAANQGDYGEEVCYTTDLTSSEPAIRGGFGVHFMRNLGDQVAIVGKRRLGGLAILDFSVATPRVEQPLLVPETTINVALFVPGPSAGPLSDEIAYALSESVRVICALALGRTVNSPLHIFPAKSDLDAQARSDRDNPSILGLARDGISLDFVDTGLVQHGPEHLARIRASLTAYEAALSQDHADVATILLVTAIEALIAPTASWGRDRVVTRFTRAVTALCPNAVDATLDHQNVEAAFAFQKRGALKRQRSELLSRIYELRSSPVHSGLGVSSSLMTSIGSPGSMRVALISDLYRSFLFAFAAAPQSFLTGHPTIDPGPTRETSG
jgi:hypothetical protein